MKTDARIVYTKKTIKDALLFLLAKLPLDKVTVTKICKQAEINRSTFYKYYLDPYDLMQQIEDETLEELSILAESPNNKSIENILFPVLNQIRENQEYYHLLFYRQAMHSFNEKLILLCCQASYPQMNAGIRYLSIKEQEWLYYFIIQGSCYILDCWIRDDMADNISQVAGFIGKMFGELLKR